MVGQGIVGYDPRFSSAVYHEVFRWPLILVHQTSIGNFEHITGSGQTHEGQKAVDDDDGKGNCKPVHQIHIPIEHDHGYGPNARQANGVENGINILYARMSDHPLMASRNEEGYKKQGHHDGKLGPKVLDVKIEAQVEPNAIGQDKRDGNNT